MKIILVAFTMLTAGCFTKNHDYGYHCRDKVYGWVPVFESDVIYKNIRTSTERPTINPGKIYVYGNYILQVEQGEGIHVIDNSNPTTPVKKGFIQVKCCAEVEMKDGFLYTNNFNDLVTLKYNFANNTVQEINRIPKTLENLNINYPVALPPEPGYYKSNIPQDSVVKSWYKDSIIACDAAYKN